MKPPEGEQPRTTERKRRKGCSQTSPASSTALSNPGNKPLPTPQASVSRDRSYIRALPLHSARLNFCRPVLTKADFEAQTSEAATSPRSLRKRDASLPNLPKDSPANSMPVVNVGFSNVSFSFFFFLRRPTAIIYNPRRHPRARKRDAY